MPVIVVAGVAVPDARLSTGAERWLVWRVGGCTGISAGTGAGAGAEFEAEVDGRAVECVTDWRAGGVLLVLSSAGPSDWIAAL